PPGHDSSSSTALRAGEGGVGVTKIASNGSFDARWDNGAGLFDSSRQADGIIDAAEIEAAGGAARFAGEVRSLPAADQRRALLAVRSPEARVMLEQGLAPGVNATDARLAGEGRRFAVEVLGLSFAETGREVEPTHIARLPARAIPISGAEHRIELLRARSSAGRPMTMVELGQFLAQHPDRAPPVAAGTLARAITDDPGRYNGVTMRVTGEAEEIDRVASTGSAYGPKMDMMTGKMGTGLTSTSILETYHRFFTPGQRDAHFVVYDRVEQTSFVAVGRLGVAGASARLPNGQFSINGTVRVRPDRPPLLILR
ncbi:MAG: hypothetical protein ACAI38_10900, partial [Myxococcota bacterium]